jgi:hypothetical protein
MTKPRLKRRGLNNERQAISIFTMTKIPFHITVPDIIARIGVWFLLRWRKWKYGYEFRRIKLAEGRLIRMKSAEAQMSAEREPAEARFAIVDADDHEKLGGYNWQRKQSNNTCYAWRMLLDEKGKWKIIFMHREVMQAPAGTIVDHKNRNGLDNRKANLRFVSRRENALNCAKRSGPSGSKYKGVCRDKKRGKWRAYIHEVLRPKHLGYFDSEEDAARAYDEAAKKSRGKSAILNFKENS